MKDVIEKGSYRVIIHEPVAAEQAKPEEVLALCAAGARNGSSDPVDLAIVHSASSRGEPFRSNRAPGAVPVRSTGTPWRNCGA